MKGGSRRDFIKLATVSGVGFFGDRVFGQVSPDGLEARVRRVANIVEDIGGYVNP